MCKVVMVITSMRSGGIARCPDYFALISYKESLTAYICSMTNMTFTAPAEEKYKKYSDPGDEYDPANKVTDAIWFRKKAEWFLLFMAER